jgi:hypothetical protein
VTTLKPHETGPDGQPFPSYRCIFPEPPPPGTVANCAEVGVLGAAVGVIGTLQATEVLKEIVGIGEGLAGRLLLYDARSARFNEIRIAWDPANPLSGKTPTIRDLSIHAGAPQERSARLDGCRSGGGSHGDPRHPVRQGRHRHRLLAHLGADQPRGRSLRRTGDHGLPTSCCGWAGTIPLPIV